MKLLKTTLVASAFVLGTASMSIAQDKSYGSGTKAKDVAVDTAKDAMMKEGDAMMKDKAKSYGSGTKAKDAMMKEGDAMMKDKAKSYGSGTKAKDAMMKEGDAMMKDKAKSYGSGAKAQDVMMKEGDAMMKDKMMHQGTIKTSAPSYGSGTTAAVPAIRCPSGTTPQANGTCMITGNYVPRS